MPIEVNGKGDGSYSKLEKLKARVTFKILSPPLRAKTSEGVIERPQTSRSIPATYTRQMPDGTHEVVRYYKTKTPMQKGSVVIDQYEPFCVTIEAGEINVSTVTDKDLYWWLLHHPHNKTNPVYDTEGKDEAAVNRIVEMKNNRMVPFDFYEVDRRKSSKTNLDHERLLKKAKEMILAEVGEDDYLDDKQVVLLCKAYNMSEVDDCIMVDDYDTLRNGLLEQAKVNPTAFMAKVESSALGIEAMVADAARLGVIKYEQPDAEDGAWFWDKLVTPEKKTQICVVPNAQYGQKEQVLIDYLRFESAGVKTSKKMKEEVNLARKAKMTASLV